MTIYLLALDASADACSVALHHPDGHIQELVHREPRTHAAHLLPFAHDLLDSAGVAWRDIAAIGVTVGPGSFTGLRIAMASAQGLAYGLDKPIVPVASLAALVRAAHKVSPQVGSLYVPALDARMGEIYWGAYYQGAIPMPGFAANIGREEDFSALLSQAVGEHVWCPVGADWHKYPFANSLLGDQEPIPITHITASVVAELAVEGFLRGEGGNLQDIELVYCRDSVAWNKRQRIRVQDTFQ